MPHDGIWIFVDDKQAEAKSFAAELERTNVIKVEVLDPSQARDQLLRKMRHPAGVLMDVDLSSVPDELGTGPGIAQDIRTKQKAKLACEFPIVRFSAAEPVQRNVLGDPSSDDLFELKIPKSDLKHRDYLVSQLLGLTQVYEVIGGLAEKGGAPDDLLSNLFNVNEEKFSKWGNEALISKISSGIKHSPHVAANVFCRFFLTSPGLLIGEELLALRLGVDRQLSANAWSQLINNFDIFKYSGAGHKNFNRWWGRGLEDWWYSSVDRNSPLAGRTSVERVDNIAEITGIAGLVPLAAPSSQESFRPWRFCKLGLESEPLNYIAVDPAECVRITPQDELPAWIEPPCASFKLAMQARGDTRLNQKDLERLRKKYKV